MSHAKRLREDAQCVGKQGFDSATLAHKVAKRRERKDRKSAVYRCAYCGLWHLGTPLERHDDRR